MSDTENLSAEFEDILDSTIEDLADYVGFEPLPLGTYKMQFGYEFDTVGDSNIPTVKVTLTLQEVIEIVGQGQDSSGNPIIAIPEEGRKVFRSYLMRKKDGSKNEISEGQLKQEILTPLKEVFGGNTIKEILHNGDGCSMICTLGIRRRKDKETKEIRSENTIKASIVDA